MKAIFASVMSLVAITACGSTAAQSPRATSTPTATTTAAATSLACRLPIGGYLPNAPKGQPDNSIGPDGFPNQKGAGGFMDLPGGVYAPAADSDRTFINGRWLPVFPQAVSTDGLTYAASRGAKLYLGDVRTGSERLVHEWPDGILLDVIAYTYGGVYVLTVSGQPSTHDQSINLYAVDPSSGAAQLVRGAATPAGAYEMVWLAVNGRGVWGMEISLIGKSPNQLPAYSLVRLDLDSGQAAKWYDSPGFLLGGFDSAHHPILTSIAGPSTTITVVTAPGKVVTVAAQGGKFMPGRPTLVSDSHGAWFGSVDGSIWLYTTEGVFKKVGTVPPQTGGSGLPYDPHSIRSVAGPCV